jgi:hypothetical protein
LLCFYQDPQCDGNDTFAFFNSTLWYLSIRCSFFQRLSYPISISPSHIFNTITIQTSHPHQNASPPPPHHGSPPPAAALPKPHDIETRSRALPQGSEIQHQPRRDLNLPSSAPHRTPFPSRSGTGPSFKCRDARGGEGRKDFTFNPSVTLNVPGSQFTENEGGS